MQQNNQIKLADIEAEQALFGAILINNGIFKNIDKIVNQLSFFNQNHQQIFRAICELDEEEKPIDEIMIADKLNNYGNLNQCGGLPYLAELLDAAPSSYNADHYAKIVQGFAAKRKAIKILQRGIAAICDPTKLGDCNKEIGLVAEAINKIQETNEISTGPKNLRNYLAEAFNQIEMVSKGAATIGFETGINQIDGVIDSIGQQDFIILAAENSTGKTSLALELCKTIGWALKKTNERSWIAFFSLESSGLSLTMNRLLPSTAEVNARHYKRKPGNGHKGLEMDEWARLAKAQDELSTLDLEIWDRPGMGTDLISRELRRISDLKGCNPSLIIIDNFPLLARPKGLTGTFAEEVISGEVKGLTKAFNSPVICLDQLNKEAVSLAQQKGKSPGKSAINGSLKKTNDADQVWIIWKPDADFQTLIEFLCLKHRDGCTGKADLIFDPQFTKFRSTK